MNSATNSRTKPRTSLAVGLLVLLLSGCGGDDDSESADVPATSDTSSGDGATADGDDGASNADEGGGAGGGGSLVIGDETITLDSARCFLEEQDAAAGGGKILFVGQGFGTNAAGDAVTLDVSRYDEDSQFTGDDILVDIGDFETGVSLQANADLGTVDVDGRVLSAEGLTFVDFDDFSEQPGSFTLNC